MAQINNPSAIPSMVVGGRVITDLTNTKFLSGRVNGAGNGNSGCRIMGGSSGYQVPASKTFKVIAILAQGVYTSGSIMLGYADNDLGTASATAPTNPVYAMSTSASVALFAGAATVAGYSQGIINFDIPTGKYPFLSNNADTTNGSIIILGYEF